MNGKAKDDAWWINAKDFLPNIGERVLVISKFGAISNQLYTNNGFPGKERFSPEGYKAGIDVKWWMPIPEDMWKEVKYEKPNPGQRVLTMGMYGVITDAIYRKSKFSDDMEFCPFCGFEPLFWREIPELPKGVVLSAQ